MVKRRSGEILLHDKPLPTAPHKVVKAGVVQVPEGRRVFANLTVTENLIMGGSRISASAAEKKLPAMYDLFPILGQRRSQLAGTLSGGEQQMLVIARGLMAEPELLLLDEPSLGLAPILVNQVFDIISGIIQSGITVLLVEQEVNAVFALASRNYVLSSGKIIAEGSGKDLLRDEVLRKTYLGL